MRDEPQGQLTSAWLNIMAAGIVSGGAVSQLVAIASGASLTPSLTIVLICIGLGCALHLAALRIARGKSQEL